MNTYYIGNDTRRIDTDPRYTGLWTEFMDAVAALDAYQEYVDDLRSMISDKEDDNADLREKIEELDAKLAEASER